MRPFRRHSRLLPSILISCLALLVPPATLPAQEEAEGADADRFAGSWHGRLAGIGVDDPDIPHSWEGIGFEMTIVDLKIGRLGAGEAGGNDREMRGFAVIRYRRPVYEGIGTGEVRFASRFGAGRLTGAMHTMGWRAGEGEYRWTMTFEEEPWEPAGTYELRVEGRIFEEDSIAGLLSVFVPHSGELDLIEVHPAGEDERLDLSHRTESAVWEYEVDGVLRRTRWDGERFPTDVGPGERIAPDGGIRKRIEIEDVGEVVANPGSELEIRSEGEGTRKETVIEHFAGELMHRSQGLGSYEVRMPEAVAAVRGTTFLTAVEEGRTLVAVFDGTVEVSAPDGGGSVSVGANEMVIVGEGGLPSDPIPFGGGPPGWFE